MGVGERYESLSSGHSLGRVNIRVVDEDVRAVSFASGSEEVDSPGLPNRLRPSLILALSLRAIMRLDVIPPGGVLVGHRLSLREPLMPGDSLDVEVIVERAWSSRERPFATLRIAFARGGSSVCVDELTAIWPTADPAALAQLPKMAGPMPGRAISQQQVERYAAVSEDHNPLHLDRAIAARGPFGELVVHGVIPAGLLLDEWAATHPESLAAGWVRLAFLSPLRPKEPFAVYIDASDETGRVVTTADERLVATLALEKGDAA